jgi:hypothetical protein
MKNKGLWIAMLCPLFFAPALHATTCSDDKVAGDWGFSINGTIVGVGPVGAIGQFHQDADGNLAGTETRSLAGSVGRETLTGTVSVNSDCTATATINVYESGSLVRITTLDLVYVNDAQAGHAVFTSLVLQPSETPLQTVVTVELTRTSAHDQH